MKIFFLFFLLCGFQNLYASDIMDVADYTHQIGGGSSSCSVGAKEILCDGRLQYAAGCSVKCEWKPWQKRLSAQCRAATCTYRRGYNPSRFIESATCRCSE